MLAAETDSGSDAISRYRACVYAALARLFAPPEPETLRWLRGEGGERLYAGLEGLGAPAHLLEEATAVQEMLRRADPVDLETAYQSSFEAGGGLRCPLNEMAHTVQTPGEALTKTFEIADVAGFYRAFGVEVTPGTERADHLTAELEFMHLLAVKEAVARETAGFEERVQVCRDASRTFLRDHLGRWVAQLAERIETSGAHPLHAAAGRVLQGFVAWDLEHLASPG